MQARDAQLKSLGTYDKYFLNDKGKHPLGRRNAVLATKAIVEKQLVTLELELRRATAKRNSAGDDNAAVRRRIDAVRRESAVFRDLFTKMEVGAGHTHRIIALLRLVLGLLRRSGDSQQCTPVPAPVVVRPPGTRFSPFRPPCVVPLRAPG